VRVKRIMGRIHMPEISNSWQYKMKLSVSPFGQDAICR